MDNDALIGRRDAARLVMAPLAALCVALPAIADAVQTKDKADAAKVARKLEKAKRRAEEESAHAVKEEREALKHFDNELSRYAQLHNRELARIGVEHRATAQTALASAITAKRSKAKQGDIFLPEIQPLLRRRLSEQLKGPDAIEARKAVTEGNAGAATEPSVAVVVTVRVNAVYPAGAARSTVPASVLLTLPVLPECLHYRFVNRDLILLDSIAQIIVDFLPTAAPVLPKQ